MVTRGVTIHRLVKRTIGIAAGGIPSIQDRVIQMAAVLMLEPIFEADLQPEQYADRAQRSALDAVSEVHRGLNEGWREVVDAGLSGYFDPIPHPELVKCLARRISDGAMLALLKQGWQMPVEESDGRGGKRRSNPARRHQRGTPQGAPISPLLSNLSMRRLVLGGKLLGHAERLQARIVNYADDFVILYRDTGQPASETMRAQRSAARMGPILLSWFRQSAKRIGRWTRMPAIGCASGSVVNTTCTGAGTGKYPDENLYETLGLVRLTKTTAHLPWAKA